MSDDLKNQIELVARNVQDYRADGLLTNEVAVRGADRSDSNSRKISDLRERFLVTQASEGVLRDTMDARISRMEERDTRRDTEVAALRAEVARLSGHNEGRAEQTGAHRLSTNASEEHARVFSGRLVAIITTLVGAVTAALAWALSKIGP